MRWAASAALPAALAACYFDRGSSPVPAPGHARPEPAWSRAIGNGEDVLARDLAVDVAGEAYVVGRYEGVLRVGDDEIESNGANDGFVMAFTPAGVPKWFRKLGGYNWDEARGVAVEPDGDVVVVGGLGGEADLGTGSVGKVTEHHPFVARIAPDGTQVWGHAMSGRGEALGVAVAPGGDLVVAGRDLVAGGCSRGGVMVARMSGSGEVRWSSCLDSRGYGHAQRVVVDARGDVLVCGTFRMQLNIGGVVHADEGGDLMYIASAPDHVFLAKLGARDGRTQWARGWLGEHVSTCEALATGREREVAVGGSFQGTLELERRRLSTVERNQDGFVATFGPDGAIARVQAIADPSEYDHVGGLVYDGDDLVVSGSAGPAAKLGASDEGGTFIAAFDARGKVRWSHRLRRGHGGSVARSGSSLTVLGYLFSDKEPSSMAVGNRVLRASPRRPDSSSWFDFFVVRFAR